MCISDWRAGRFMRSASTSLVLTAATPLTIQSNQQRVGLRLCVVSSDILASAAIDLKFRGVVIWSSLSTPSGLHLTLDKDGDVVTSELTIVNIIGGPFTIGMTETFMSEEFLNEGTEQWKRTLQGLR